jgi:hypothetical protein
MVQRYTRSVTFNDSLKVYRAPLSLEQKLNKNGVGLNKPLEEILLTYSSLPRYSTLI